MMDREKLIEEVNKRSGAYAYLTLNGKGDVFDTVIDRHLEPVPDFLSALAPQDDEGIIKSACGVLEGKVIKAAVSALDRPAMASLLKSLETIDAESVTICKGVTVTRANLACEWNSLHADKEKVYDVSPENWLQI